MSTQDALTVRVYLLTQGGRDAGGYGSYGTFAGEVIDHRIDNYTLDADFGTVTFSLLERLVAIYSLQGIAGFRVVEDDEDA